MRQDILLVTLSIISTLLAFHYADYLMFYISVTERIGILLYHIS